MVAHASLQLLQAHLVVGDNPQRHRLGILLLTHSIGQIAIHVGREMIEEAPHAGLAVAASAKVGSSVGRIKREILVLSAEEALLAGKLDDILRVEHVLLVLQVKRSDAALVGMSADSIVRNADGHPNGTRAPRALANHLHNPRLVGVADSEGLAFRIISVLLHQRRHHLDSLAGSLGALQSEIHQRAIVDDARRIHQLFATAKGSLADAHLVFVDVADYIISNGCLRNLPVTLVRIVVDNAAHLALSMRACRIVAEPGKHTIVVGIIGAHHRPVLTGILAHDKISACRSPCCHA